MNKVQMLRRIKLFHYEEKDMNHLLDCCTWPKPNSSLGKKKRNLILLLLVPSNFLQRYWLLVGAL
jgi:hypothetical protein